MTKKRTVLLIVIAFLAISTFLSAAPIPEETVIAEFGENKIIVKQLNERINNIPAMYRQKYNTPEGKVKLLESLCVEELFYLLAIEEKIEEDADVALRLKPQLEQLYSQELNKEIAKEFVLTDDALRAYYIENTEEFPGKTFEEAREALKMKVGQQLARDYVAVFSKEIVAKYNAEINEEVFAKIDFEALENNDEILNEKMVTASEASIELIVKDFVTYYKDLNAQGRVTLKSSEELRNFISNMREASVLNFEAIARGIDKREDVLIKTKQFKHSMILRTIYNKKVVETIDLSDEAVRRYYDDNIEEFSSRPSRQIQQFVFEDEKIAKKMRKAVRKLVNKGKDDELNLLIKDNSLKPEKDGILSHIYKNNIIPGLGKDENYSKQVWDLNPKKVSKIFKDMKENYVFIRIIEDNVATAEVFEEISNKIKTKMQRDLSKEKFEEITEELKTKYDLKVYPERLVVKLTAKEYFDNSEKAQKAKRYDDAIYYYDQVIKYYPQSPNEYKALFMKAFLYAEELNQNNKAVEIFNQLLTQYEEGELHDSARFMISEITGDGSATIDFED